MGTILRSLNTTNTRKRRTLLPSDSMGSSRFRANANSMNVMPVQEIMMPGISKVREVDEQEADDDEIYWVAEIQPDFA